MSIRERVFAYGIIALVRKANRMSAVNKVADEIDLIIDTTFKKTSEKIQSAIVGEILLPLAERLMKEQPTVFSDMLIKFQKTLP